MCGGRGTRLDADSEKPLLPIAGRPMLGRVLDALADSRVDCLHAVVSPHTPRTRAWLRNEGDAAAPGGSDRVTSVIDAPGDGYVADLDHALDRVGSPVLTVAADLPLLRASTADRVLDHDGERNVTVCVPRSLPAALGASVGGDATLDGDPHLLATGLNVVRAADTPPDRLVVPAPDLAVNVNTRRDATLATHLLTREERPAAFVDQEAAP